MRLDFLFVVCGERGETLTCTSLYARADREKFTVFRPKHFRHLHTVVTTGIEPVEGIAHFHQIMVNAPEKHVVAALKKAATETTPLAVTYSSASVFAMVVVVRRRVVADCVRLRDCVQRWRARTRRRARC